MSFDNVDPVYAPTFSEEEMAFYDAIAEEAMEEFFSFGFEKLESEANAEIDAFLAPPPLNEKGDGFAF